MKNKIIYGLLFAFIISMLFTTTNISENKPTFAEEEKIQYVTIMGVGEIESAPDTAQINIGIQKLSDSMFGSQTKTNEIIDTITNKIKEIDGDATLTINYSSCYPVNNNGITSYESNSNISITTKQLDKVNNIIKSCSDAGATSFCNVCYTIENEKELYNQALIKAKENSYTKATALYDNVTLKDLYEVSISTFRNNSIENNIIVKAFVKAKYIINSSNTEDNINEGINDQTNENELSSNASENLSLEEFNNNKDIKTIESANYIDEADSKPQEIEKNENNKNMNKKEEKFHNNRNISKLNYNSI